MIKEDLIEVLQNKMFKVQGMTCHSCEMLIADSLCDEEGVQKVDASNDKNEVVVEFDESKISENKIKFVIENEGYKVE